MADYQLIWLAITKFSPHSSWMGGEDQTTPLQSAIGPLDSPNVPHLEPISSLSPHPTTPTLPIILNALTHPEAGVRHGAAMCLRSLTRSMSVMHTTVGGSAAVGLLLNILVFHDTSTAGGAESGENHRPGVAEDKRVIVMVLKALANLSNNDASTQLQNISSPAFKHIRARVRISEEEDPTGSILQYATWLMQNYLFHAGSAETRRVLDSIGWDYFQWLITHTQASIRVIASTMLQNLTAREETARLVCSMIPDLASLFASVIGSGMASAMQVDADEGYPSEEAESRVANRNANLKTILFVCD
ncbi:hypothetical protein DL93DRAFT_2173241 [Clavulina sp. PMI_390]|nr:hypothetical protein DL93DRAFT_2173241 [Clavulina sp. PMI_390]